MSLMGNLIKFNKTEPGFFVKRLSKGFTHGVSFVAACSLIDSSSTLPILLSNIGIVSN